MNNRKWLIWFEKMACFVSEKSKDRSTKVGAVIIGDSNEVISIGYNGMVRNFNDNIEERQERPQKYLYYEHAERNAIFNAARNGIPLKGTTIVMNFAPYPCADCVRAIIQSGITTVVGYKHKIFQNKGKNWEESMDAGKIMMKEVGIIIVEL